MNRMTGVPATLIAKELRQLLPWALTMAFVEIAGTLMVLAEAPADEFVWASATPLLSSAAASGRTASLTLWAFVLAYAGFPREHEDDTLRFLFALPVSRTALFAAKFAGGAIVLLSVVLTEELLNALLQLANPSSFGGRTFRGDWAALSLALSGALALVMLGYAHFCSILRRLGVIAAFIVWSLVEWLGHRQPSLKALNPRQLIAVDFHGSDVIVPWGALAGTALLRRCSLPLRLTRGSDPSSTGQEPSCAW
jgi:hypothetical protein